MHDEALDPRIRPAGSVSRMTDDMAAVRAGHHKAAAKGGQASRKMVTDFTEHATKMLSAAGQGRKSVQAPPH